MTEERVMTAGFTLSAFGDEISDDLRVQLDTLVSLNIAFLELRGVWGKNVLDLSDEEVDQIHTRCRESGITVSAIGSPIGKSLLEAPSEKEMTNLLRAFDIAASLGTRFIRVFSFYPPDSSRPQEFGTVLDQAVERLSSLADMAEQEGYTLLMENEKGIVGDTIAHCHFILSAVGSPSLRFTWDPANFVQVGETAPTQDGWPWLGAYVAHVHIKDAIADGEVKPAGQGDGQIGLLLDKLRASDYAGFLALEPHLEIAGHSSGFSGVSGMKEAVDKLRQLMNTHRCSETSSAPTSS